MRVCAYCGKSGNLTKEHIFPDFLLEIYPNYRTFGNIQQDKTVKAPPTIKDVCQPCNNGPLSVLDSYGSKLTRKYFKPPEDTKPPISFQYDYHKLTRWLLKISYNDARSIKKWHREHEVFIDYIVGRNQGPPLAITLLSTLIRPSKLTAQEQEIAGDEFWYPKVHKIGTVFAYNRDYDRQMHLGRWLGLNSFLLNLLAWKPGVPRQERKRIVKGFEADNGLVKLKENENKVILTYGLMDAKKYDGLS